MADPDIGIGAATDEDFVWGKRMPLSGGLSLAVDFDEDGGRRARLRRGPPCVIGGFSCTTPQLDLG